MIFIYSLLLLLSPVCTIFYAQVNHSGRAVLSPRHTDIPRHLGWTGGFVNTSLTHTGDFGVILPACSVASVGLGVPPRHVGRAMSPLESAELTRRRSEKKLPIRIGSQISSCVVPLRSSNQATFRCIFWLKCTKHSLNKSVLCSAIKGHNSNKVK